MSYMPQALQQKLRQMAPPEWRPPELRKEEPQPVIWQEEFKKTITGQVYEAEKPPSQKKVEQLTPLLPPQWRPPEQVYKKPYTGTLAGVVGSVESIWNPYVPSVTGAAIQTAIQGGRPSWQFEAMRQLGPGYVVGGIGGEVVQTVLIGKGTEKLIGWASRTETGAKIGRRIPDWVKAVFVKRKKTLAPQIVSVPTVPEEQLLPVFSLKEGLVKSAGQEGVDLAWELMQTPKTAGLQVIKEAATAPVKIKAIRGAVITPFAKTLTSVREPVSVVGREAVTRSGQSLVLATKPAQAAVTQSPILSAVREIAQSVAKPTVVAETVPFALMELPKAWQRIAPPSLKLGTYPSVKTVQYPEMMMVVTPMVEAKTRTEQATRTVQSQSLRQMQKQILKQSQVQMQALRMQTKTITVPRFYPQLYRVRGRGKARRLYGAEWFSRTWPVPTPEEVARRLRF